MALVTTLAWPGRRSTSSTHTASSRTLRRTSCRRGHGARGAAARRSSSRRRTTGTSTCCSRSPSRWRGRSRRASSSSLRLVTPARSRPGSRRRPGDPAGFVRARRPPRPADGARRRRARAAFTTPDPGDDLVRLAADETIDLLLMNGRRPLLGEGIPRGEVGEVLADAPCDVAVLVDRARHDRRSIREHPVVVPFGGADHDWAALELGAWIAHSSGAPLRLLGAAGGGEGGRDASRLLANASLVVQQLAGVVAEPVLVDERARGQRGGAGRRAPRRRPRRGLARAGSRPRALGDRALGPRTDRLRPPRRAAPAPWRPRAT